MADMPEDTKCHNLQRSELQSHEAISVSLETDRKVTRYNTRTLNNIH